MSQRKAHEVDSFLAKIDRRFPIVLIYGPDKGLVSERARRFAANTGLPFDDPFVTVRVDASDIENDPTKLLDEAYTISLFGNDRLVWLKNVAGQKKIIDALKMLVAEPPRHCTILIEAGDLKKGVGVRQLIENAPNAMACPCYSDDANSLDQLIDDLLDQYKLTLSLDARKILRESLGGDRLASRSELEKLCLYCLHAGHISLDDVLQIVSDVGNLSQDDVIDALLTGNISNFNDKFNKFIAAKIPVFLLLSALQRVFQQLQLLRYAVEKNGKTPYSAVASARPPIFFKRQKLFEQAIRYWSLSSIIKAMNKVQFAILNSRKTPVLDGAITRQTLLGLTIEAAKAAKSHASK